MTQMLEIRAGRTALAHIRENGLSPSDIRVVTGASGAAKWLSIYGLYRALFSRWLNAEKHPVFLFGTSIGAWTMAAGACNDPEAAFDRLKQAYIRQRYKGKITPEKITLESFRILDQVFGAGRIDEILAHPCFTLGFSAVRCKGSLALESRAAQLFGVFSGFALNLFSRRTQGLLFERTLFHAPFSKSGVDLPLNLDGFHLSRVELGLDNFSKALLASGSIPYVMEGMKEIPGAPEGVYRDGGVLDYHPALPMMPDSPGFILFPHFYPHIIPGWFDKTLPARRARGPLLDRTILLCPSRAFVESLPFQRIPDRKDFLRFRGKDAFRYKTWETAAAKSLELGREFLEAAETGKIRSLVLPID